MMSMGKILMQIGKSVIVAVFMSCLLLSQAAAQRGGGAREAQVVVKPVTSQIINDRLSAIGTGSAAASVAVTPWSSGKLENFAVKAGDMVTIGQVIAALDSDNEQIMVDRARVELDDARETLERLTRLASSDTASRVQVINAELALAKARLNLRDGELALERRIIRAPIDGIVGILAVDAGNTVTTSTVLARIDNRDKILIDVWLPERFASQVTAGQAITARAIASSGEVFNGHVSAIDNALDEASRTLRVRAEILNEGDRLRAGMSFAVSFVFAGERYASVDPLAIQWRSEGAYVWRIDESRNARRVAVSIVQRSSDHVLISGEIEEGQLVVVQGVHNVRDGAPVQIKDMPQIKNIPGSETPAIETETVSSISQN